MVKRTETEVPWTEGRDVWWHEVVDKQSDEHEAQPFDAEHPLFILYTSGTTGKPKGILHTSGGFLTQAAYTHHVVFDHKPGESVYWCTADIGWVTGHSYIVYGPLANRATSVIYEGTPNTPHEGRHWEIIQKYGVSIYYTAPTLIRTFMKWGKEIPEKYDLRSLKVLGSVGEPINPEAWMWYRENVGHDNCPIVDTWWQTETGAIMVSPLPGVTDCKPGSAMRPLPGIAATVVDESGEPVGHGEGGYLVLDKPWPAMLRGIWGDEERYVDTYWSRFAEQGYYFAGDGAKYDEDGAIWLLGRVDDVMNVSGHRISTTEVESALVSHPTVAEAAVVGASDPTTGQGIVAFVILRGSASQEEAKGEAAIKALRDHVAKEIGPIAKPRQIMVVDELPKTRSGKIMRRLLQGRGGEPRGRRRHHAGRLDGDGPDLVRAQGGQVGGLTAVRSGILVAVTEGDLHVRGSLALPERELRWRFSRASGPGGQGVNTTDSRVELSFDLAGSPSVPEPLRARALARLAGRLVDGVLTVVAAEHRSQLRNREAARERLAAALRAAMAPDPPPRRPTRPSAGAKRRRLDAKTRRGQIKRLRGRPED